MPPQNLEFCQSIGLIAALAFDARLFANAVRYIREI
jgi:hypothetical protein